MLVPLAVLALGAVFAGLAVLERLHRPSTTMSSGKARSAPVRSNHLLHEMHEIPSLVGFLPFLMMAGGFLVAVWFYILSPGIAGAPGARQSGPLPLPAQQVVLRRALRLHLRAPGLLARPRCSGSGGDGRIIDGLGPDGVAARVVDVTNRVVRLQTGYIYHYAFAMLLGVAAFVTWYLVGGVR